MIEKIKQDIKKSIEETLQITNVTIEKPRRLSSDLAIPLFSHAKQLEKALPEVYELVKPLVLKNSYVESVALSGGFLNIELKREHIAKEVITRVLELKETYGDRPKRNETVLIDYSSPNIAKSFGVGHLRSTVIGNALKLLYRKLGYDVVGINYLGDWGTQFGKMIVAYQKWGDDDKIQLNPIDELQKLYVKFHEEEKNDPTLEQKGRDAFRLLEEGDLESRRIWSWFKDESLKEFMKMYQMLDVQFESFQGESYYNDKMDDAINELESLNLLKIDDGATIVDLGDEYPPALIRRRDGATLYITRDIAAILNRHQEHNFKKIIYVVGNEQTLHFKQLEELTKKMGYKFDIAHVGFGLVMQDGKKMSTRGGRFEKLTDVIEEAIKRAKNAIIEKSPNLENKDEIARIIGIGAVLFNDLKNERNLQVDFDLEQMLQFEGQTGPYLLYTIVRINSILRENEFDPQNIDLSCFKENHYFEIIESLDSFPHILNRAMNDNAPSTIAKYLLDLSQSFNHFYGREKILHDDVIIRNTNLVMLKAILEVASEGLRLLGIKKLERM